MSRYSSYGSSRGGYRSQRSSVNSYSISSSSSSSSSDQSIDDDFIQTVNIVKSLIPLKHYSVSDPNVDQMLANVKSRYQIMDGETQAKFKQYINTQVCPSMINVSPNTVGAVLCGCVKKCKDGKSGCTASCSDCMFNTSSCEETVLHWFNTPEGPMSRIASPGGSKCRIYVDKDFRASAAQIDEFLRGSGCTEFNRYDSVNNETLSEDAEFAKPTRTTSNSTGSVNGNSNIGNNGISMKDIDANTDSTSIIFWLLAIFVFLIIIGVLVYIYLIRD